MNKAIIGILSITVASFYACQKPLDAGQVIVEDRVLADSVTSIQANGSFDVYITQDTNYDVRVEAGENVMPYIYTALSNHELRIDERTHHFIRNKTVRVYVSAHYINEIELKGSGDIYGEHLLSNQVFVKLKGSGNIDLDFDLLTTLTTNLDGSGDIDITGTANDCNIELEGSGNVNCKNLVAQDVFVDLDGSGDIRVTALNSLVCNITGSGDIYYWGNPPSVSTNTSGSGNIIEM